MTPPRGFKRWIQGDFFSFLDVVWVGCCFFSGVFFCLVVVILLCFLFLIVGDVAVLGVSNLGFGGFLCSLDLFRAFVFLGCVLGVCRFCGFGVLRGLCVLLAFCLVSLWACLVGFSLSGGAFHFCNVVCCFPI